MASSMSPVMPIDSSRQRSVPGSPDARMRSRVLRRCEKPRRITISSCTCAPIVISPRNSMPSNVPIFCAMRMACAGSQPDFDSSPDSLTSSSTPTVIPRATALREIFSAKSIESTDSIVSTTGSTLPILLLCSWPIRWNGICSAAASGAAPATPSENPRSAHRRASPSAFAVTSCGRFSPIMRTPASIATMISPMSRVFVAASRRTEPASRPACSSAAAMRSSTRCTPSVISRARASSITSLARFL